MRWTLPNILTLLRVGCIPFLVLAFYLSGPSAGFLSALIFLIAAITDWLDGWLARTLNQESEFGAFMDPVADKLIVATALVLLVAHYDNIWITLAAMVIIGREILVSALREWMARSGRSESVAVTIVAKFKTTLQMTAITLLLWRAFKPNNDIWLMAGYVAMAIAVFLTLWSMWNYLQVMLGKATDNETA